MDLNQEISFISSKDQSKDWSFLSFPFAFFQISIQFIKIYLKDTMGVYTGYTAIMDMMQYDKGIERYLSEIELPHYTAPQILDIGCGSGVASLALAKRFPDAHILTTDINKRFVQDTLAKLISR